MNRRGGTSSRDAGVARQFRAHVAGSTELAAADRVVVALSGGLDSVALLHLLRFSAPARELDVRAAHFDHAMRPTSHRDAEWVAGLCRAWDVPLTVGRAAAAPGSEAEAREARYAFLENVRRDLVAAKVLTAHHADDQAETVLFRVLRGTGQAGLVGIAPTREPSIHRPLLGFWREEIEAYAAAVRLHWREDPTNRELRYARNVLRARVLPDIERLVAPGARRALIRLAERAHEDEAGWSSVLPTLLAPLDVRRDPAELSLDRGALLALHPAVRARVLRALAQEVGARLDDSATGRALDFVASGASGRRIELGGPWRLARELGRLVFRVERARSADRPVHIHDAGPGFGEALLAGSAVRVRWGEKRRGALAQGEAFDAQQLRFPLVVRAREPGDRIRLAGGSKKVKALLLERRIPHARRGSLPLLADAEGEVLWIPEIARAAHPVTNRPSGVPCWIEVG